MQNRGILPRISLLLLLDKGEKVTRSTKFMQKITLRWLPAKLFATGPRFIKRFCKMKRANISEGPYGAAYF